MEYSGNYRADKPYYLPLLFIISAVSHFPFVLKGFGEIDATKIAVGVIDILNNGPNAAFVNFYFTDVIPLYILYLKWSMKLLNYDYSLLPAVMNYTNAVIGTLTVIPAFLLIRQLFRNPAVAFCAVLAQMFAPSFYQATIMGFPHLIAFFFFLTSLCFFLSGLDHSQNRSVYIMMLLACASLTVAFLFKSDIVLAGGAYFGVLIIRKIRDKSKFAVTFMIIFIAGILFLLLRDVILGHSGGTTMSKEGLSKWYAFSLVLPSSIGYYISQAKPVVYGAGVATFCLGGVAFIYYVVKRRLDVLALLISWAALPTIFWFIMIGNNARHNMITTLPLLVMIIVFFHEKAPRYVTVLTAVLVLSNFFLTSPSFSIITPSGNLYTSSKLLEERMRLFESLAKEIADIEDDRIVVLGTFHNPHVVIELMRNAPSYKAVKIGRENYKLQAGGKEYVFIYFVVVNPEDMEAGIDEIIKEYQLADHVFVSATYDLEPLRRLGLKTKSVDIIKRSEI